MATYTINTGRRGKQTVSYECAHCHSPLESPLGEAGESFPCPTCGRKVQTPGIKENQQARREASTASKASKPGAVTLLWTNAVTLVLLTAVCSVMYLRAKPASSPQSSLPTMALPVLPHAQPRIAITESGESQLLHKALAATAADNTKLKAELAMAKGTINKLNERSVDRDVVATKPLLAPGEPPPIAAVVRATPAKFGEGHGSIGGSAWITRKSGASDILRGLHIQILTPTCPFQVYADSAEAAAIEFEHEDQKNIDYFRQNPELGAIPNSRLYKRAATALHAVRQGSKDDAPLDVVFEALKDAPNGGDYLAPIVKATSLGDTTSNVDGKWKISGLPDGRYFIFARFDSAVYVEWMVPITVTNGKADPSELNLFNDNAGVTKG